MHDWSKALQLRKQAEPIKGQMKEGLQWVYQHRYLRILALNIHAWFFFHSIAITVLVTFAIIELQFSSMILGIVLAAAGIGAVIGTSCSTYAAHRWGMGRVMIFSQSLYGSAVILIALAPAGHQDQFQLSALLIVISGQFFYGFAMGIEGPLETGYRQFVTPMRLQGRMNATMRSINRSMIIIGAPIGGVIAESIGFRSALWVAVIGLYICAIWFSLTPIRNVSFPKSDMT